jgi:lipoprotein-releasing system permease protein
MRIAIVATSVSVAAMIISTSFINGFQQVVADKIFDFWGHLRIEHYEPIRFTNAEAALIEKNDSIEKIIKKDPSIDHVAPFVTHSAIVNTNGTIEGVVIKGVGAEYPKEKIKKYLRRGVIPNWTDSAQLNQLVLSQYTANQLKTDIGKSILIYFISKDGSPPKVRKMIVAGIYNTGIDLYDQTYAIADLGYMNQVNHIPATSINGYEIHLKDKKWIDRTANSIFPQLPMGWNVITLKELSPEIFDWLQLQDTNKYVLISIMLLVAIINMITCLIILLLERTNMIAVLKSMGAKDGLIQRIFIFYGGWIAGTGILIGGIAGIVICLVQRNYPFIRLNEEVYYVNSAPVFIDWIQIAAILAGTFIISMLILILPTVVSKKINISKTLQFK